MPEFESQRQNSTFSFSHFINNKNKNSNKQQQFYKKLSYTTSSFISLSTLINHLKMIFNFCNGGESTEEAVKETSVIEFDPEDQEIIEFLMKQGGEEESQLPTSSLVTDSSYSTSAATSYHSISDMLPDNLQAIDQKATEGIDWDREIETFSNNMKHLHLGKENENEKIVEKKRSRKKKSLRNNKNKQQVLQARGLQLRASVNA
jgi:hypothetical protein